MTNIQDGDFITLIYSLVEKLFNTHIFFERKYQVGDFISYHPKSYLHLLFSIYNHQVSTIYHNDIKLKHFYSKMVNHKNNKSQVFQNEKCLATT